MNLWYSFWAKVAQLPFFSNLGASNHTGDANVYLWGSQCYWTHGCDIYAVDAPYRFTYPPFAALFFTPLQLATEQTLPYLLLPVQLLLAVAAAYLILVACKRDVNIKNYLIVLAILTVSIYFKKGLTLGQVHTLLVCLILLDFTGIVKKWIPQGLLTGIAASIKVLPAALILVFLFNKKYKSAMWLIVGYLVTNLIGLIQQPHNTWLYWTKYLWDTGRVQKDIGYGYNLSLAAIWDRFSLPHPALLALYLVIIAFMFAGLWFTSKQNDMFAGLLVMQLSILLINKVSWNHHWLWVVVTIVYLFDKGLIYRIISVIMAVIACLFARRGERWDAVGVGAPPEFYPPNGLEVWWQQTNLTGTALFSFIALVAIVVMFAKPVLAKQKTASV